MQRLIILFGFAQACFTDKLTYNLVRHNAFFVQPYHKHFQVPIIVGRRHTNIEKQHTALDGLGDGLRSGF